MKREQRGKREQRRGLVYILGAFAVALLICAAFLMPRIFFDIQDNIRCGKVTLGELERVDITSFNTDYERNLYKRLLRFAEGLNRGKQYYVAAQEMEPSQEILDYLQSDRGLYQDAVLILIDQEYIPEEVLQYNLRQWKQYVIYGDNFSEGVNFTLWYIELGNEGTPTLKLLADAETGDLYGISMRRQLEDFPRGKGIYEIEGTWREISGIDGEVVLDIGMNIGRIFGIWNDQAFLSFPELSGYVENTEMMFSEERVAVDNHASSEGSDGGGGLVTPWEIRWGFGDDGNCLDYFFPLVKQGTDGERCELRFRLDMRNFVGRINEWKREIISPARLLIGYPDIYGQIPEFAQETEDI